MFNHYQDIIKNLSRPLDYAKWKYLNNDASKEDVIKELLKYQNGDGGFGHGIEPDFLNPNTSPIGTWQATTYLKDLDMTGEEPIVKDILRYLESGFDFNGRMWLNTVPTNNIFPHAIWWTDQEDNYSWNPTIALAGFYAVYGDKHNDFYHTIEIIIKDGFNWYLNHKSEDIEVHVLSCFNELYDYLFNANINGLIDLNQFKNKLIKDVYYHVEKDITKWDTNYCFKPSNFFNKKSSIHYPALKKVVEDELKYLEVYFKNKQTFPITWQWATDYEEFEQAKKYWEAILTINAITYYKNMQ